MGFRYARPDDMEAPLQRPPRACRVAFTGFLAVPQPKDVDGRDKTPSKWFHTTGTLASDWCDAAVAPG